MTGRFALDRSNKKLLGVCAGFARWADVDVMPVRIAAVALTLLGVGSTILLYLVVAMVAESR